MIPSFDGVELAVHEMGDGAPVLLLHGLFSSAEMNWIRFGHAASLADAGFHVFMPDLRAHGSSGKPHDPSCYPPDVLVQDVKAMVEALGLEAHGFDLGGFSLGARTALRAVMQGVQPRRLMLAGMGLEGLSNWQKRVGFFLDAIDRFDDVKQGDPAYFAVQFMKSMKIDRQAARLLLSAVDGSGQSDMTRVTVPTLVICGDKDRDNGSPEALADALPGGQLAEIPGTHMSSVTGPELGQAMVAFLTA